MRTPLVIDITRTAAGWRRARISIPESVAVSKVGGRQSIATHAPRRCERAAEADTVIPNDNAARDIDNHNAPNWYAAIATSEKASELQPHKFTGGTWIVFNECKVEACCGAVELDREVDLEGCDRDAGGAAL